MARSALPQNNMRTVMSEVKNFSGTWAGDIGAWNGGVLTSDTDHVLFGNTKSLMITGTGAGSNIGAQFIISKNFQGCHTVRVWIYVDAENLAKINNFWIYFSPLAAFTTYLRGSISATYLHSGWNEVSFVIPDFFVSSESWNNTMVRCRVAIGLSAGVTASATFGAIYTGAEDFRKCVLTFDDNRKSIIDTVYPILSALGIRATVNVVPAYVGLSANYMTVDDLDTLYAAGWGLCNHTMDHTNLTTLTESEVIDEIQDADAYLISHGWTRGLGHVAYPFNAYNDTVLSVMASLSMKSGRAGHLLGLTGNESIYVPYQIRSTNVENTTTLAQANAIGDLAIYHHRALCTYQHNICETPAETTDWSTANFTAWIAYMIGLRYQFVTIDEWYEGLTNPRYQSLPVGRT